MRIATLTLALLLPAMLWAENFKVVDLTGAPKFRAPKQLEAKAIQKGDELAPGGRVKMEAADTLNLETSMGDKITLTGKTYVMLSELTKDASGKTNCQVEMFEGVINNKVHKLQAESVYQVRSPAAVAGVRGTEFCMEVKATGETTVECTEGQVEVKVGTADAPPVPVGAGKSASVKTDGTVKVTVANGIQKQAETRATSAAGKKEEKKEDKKEEKKDDKAGAKSEAKSESSSPSGSAAPASDSSEAASIAAAESAADAVASAVAAAKDEQVAIIQEIATEAAAAAAATEADIKISIDSIIR